MLHKGICILVLAFLSANLAACDSIFPFHKPSARLPSRQQLCTQLKHQMVFENNPMGPVSPNNVNQQYLPITQARLLNQYNQYNCDQYENR